ncbi:hypothetical protein B9T16_30040, partial [Arthrospira sp. PCC 8006]
MGVPGSAETAGDEVLGPRPCRTGEQPLRLAVLDHLPTVHEGGEAGHAAGLLQVVGDQQDGGALFQFGDQRLDVGGAGRVQG